MSKIFNTSLESNDHHISPIDKFRDISSCNTCHSSNCFILVAGDNIRRSKDRLELGFMDREKNNGIPNFNLPLILAVTIVESNLTGFFVDNKSSCNILYAYTMDLLGIKQTNMKLYNWGDLLAPNNLISHPQGAINMIVTIGEGACQRKVILNFMLILCQSAFKCIIWRSFLLRLDAIASSIHRKVTYHNA